MIVVGVVDVYVEVVVFFFVDYGVGVDWGVQYVFFYLYGQQCFWIVFDVQYGVVVVGLDQVVGVVGDYIGQYFVGGQIFEVDCVLVVVDIIIGLGQ